MTRLNRREFLIFSSLAPVSMIMDKKFHGLSVPVENTGHSYDPWIEVDLNRIGWNLVQVRKQAANRPVMAVIKANAYGFGLVETAKYLEKQNIAFLAVGNVREALELRKNGIKTKILNFGPFSSKEAVELVKNNISQSVYTDRILTLSEAAQKLEKKAAVHVKVDTGLGRVGVPCNKTPDYLEKVSRLPNIYIEGIFMAFTENKEFDKIQLKRFIEVCESASKSGINVGIRHAASSAALLSFPEAHLDMVRPGITLYGYYPSEKEEKLGRLDLKPAMTLKARVMLVKTLEPGESVSYHRSFTAKKKTLVATLPVGYSDGFRHQIAGKGDVLIRGRRWPIIGSITSNHTTVDVTGGNVIAGDSAVFIGEQNSQRITAEEVALWADDSVYKIVIGMNPLLPRKYHFS